MRKPQNFQWKEMTMGTCYYPEHWSRELWQDDLQRMKAAGITVIRVAEFGWNKVEPEEGVFTFDLREARKKEIVMNQSRKAYLLVDTSKEGKRGFARAFGLEDCILITERND